MSMNFLTSCRYKARSMCSLVVSVLVFSVSPGIFINAELYFCYKFDTSFPPLVITHLNIVATLCKTAVLLPFTGNSCLRQ